MARLHQSPARLAGLILGMACLPRVADAQAAGVSECRSKQPPSIGVTVGRSSPYIELWRQVAGVPPGTSLPVRSGLQMGGRADLPVTGPVRLRLEGSTGRWDVRRKTYDRQNGEVIEDASIGYLTVRQMVALVGFRGGRAPCGSVFGGPGLYSIGFRDLSARSPGFSLAGGLDVPAGRHGAVHLEAALHMILTGEGHPITSFTAVPAASLSVGWAYRF